MVGNNVRGIFHSVRIFDALLLTAMAIRDLGLPFFVGARNQSGEANIRTSETFGVAERNAAGRA